jgi:hypothetical protein
MGHPFWSGLLIERPGVVKGVLRFGFEMSWILIILAGL